MLSSENIEDMIRLTVAGVKARWDEEERMALASRAGRDRADVGSRLTVIADGVRLSSQVRRSSERQLAITVPRMRDGRRVRRALGTSLTICWQDLGEVRSRTYDITDVLGGTDPQWLLVPVAGAEAGNRRMVPRTGIAAPFGVRGPAGLVVGTTVDMSPSGARVRFAPHRRGERIRPLPKQEDHVDGVVLINGIRLEFTVEVVRAMTVDGCRELRLAFTDLHDTARMVLQDTLHGLEVAPPHQQQIHVGATGLDRLS